MDREPITDKPVEIDPRVVFAAERTLLAWIRTGLSMMGFGFVVARFGLFLRELVAAATHQAHSDQTAPRFSLWIGIILVLLGVVVNIVAIQQHFRNISRLNRGETLYPAPISPGATIAAILAMLGIGIAAYLFLVVR